MTDKNLYELMAMIYSRHRNDPRVVPAWLATEAVLELDPQKISPLLLSQAAHLHFRQIARCFCRKHFSDEPQAEQNELFPDLQTRYPAAHCEASDDAEYVLLEQLSPQDVEYNIARLRAEGNAKLKHADALEEWARHRFAA